MRIAYLTDIDLSERSGVLIKHKMQCDAWLNLGHEVKIFNVPSVFAVKPSLINIPHQVFDNKYCYFLKRGFAVFLRKILVGKNLIEALESYKPDIVYVRSTTWYPALNDIVSFYKVVFEFNAIIEKEMQITFSKRMQRIHLMRMNSVYEKMTGVIGVTDEIKNYYTRIYDKKGITIGNGFDIIGVKQSQPIRENNNRPQLIYVCSPAKYSWHGLDKFEKLIELIPEADFHLVGPRIESNKLPKNLYQHGLLEQKELQNLYGQMDIGIGSLALHRDHLLEASPLKVREYCAFGLPIILPYKDTDLSGQDFVLEIDNSEDTVNKNINCIKKFIEKWTGKKIPKDIVIPLIDSSYKEMMRIQFMENLSKEIVSVS